MRHIPLAAVIAAVVAGCGAGDSTPPTLGPPVSVADALLTDGEPVQVQGYLFVGADGSVTLADAIAESYPPQPGGPRLAVENLDLAAYELQSEGEVRWTDVPVIVVGEVDGDTLTVTSQG